MVITRQRQVLDGLDDLAGRCMRRAGKTYNASLIAPMRAAVARVKPRGDDEADLDRLLKALGPATFRRMDETDLAEVLHPMLDQCEAIGEASATPKEKLVATIRAVGVHDFRPMSHDEAAEFVGRKAAMGAEAFAKLSKVNKARAFTIAGVHKARLLQQARNVIHRAIREGWSFRKVSQQLEELFAHEGIPRPALYRLRLVFRQNTFSAYSVARRRKLEDPEIAGAFPFWQYLTVGNGRHGINNVRDAHADLHGKVLAMKDRFWGRFYPPWQWNCRCFVRAMTKGQVVRGRLTIWTYRGGAVVVNHALMNELMGRGRGRRRKPVRIAPDPKFDFPRDVQDPQQFDLKRLDAEIAALVKAA